MHQAKSFGSWGGESQPLVALGDLTLRQALSDNQQGIIQIDFAGLRGLKVELDSRPATVRRCKGMNPF
jgi:hypothetical protein